MQKYYPNDKIKNREDSKKKEQKMLRYNDNKKAVIFLCAGGLLFVVSAIIVANMGKDFLITTLVLSLIALLMLSFSILGFASMQKDRKTLQKDVGVRENENIALYDEHLEYHYTENNENYILSMKYESFAEIDYDNDGVRLCCYDEKDVLLKKETQTGYEIDSAYKSGNLFIPNYFSDDNKTMNAILEKLK